MKSKRVHQYSFSRCDNSIKTEACLLWSKFKTNPLLVSFAKTEILTLNLHKFTHYAWVCVAKTNNTVIIKISFLQLHGQ